ncbi:MAG TPA: amidohydrolase family protein [Pseudonocardia sp.]
MRVDVHTHFVPPAFFDLMQDAGAARDLESFAVFGPMLRPGTERLFAAGVPAVFENWTEQMDSCSVDLSVLSIGALQPYFPERHTAVDVTRRTNAMLAEALDTAGPRFAAFGSLPLPHADAAVDEVRFCLDECRFVGINLGTSAGGRPLDAPEFDPVWAALDERRATVFLHPGTTPRMGVGADEFHLAPDFCSPTETALALCRLVAGRVTHRYPHVRIIAAAMGGALPFFAHRFDTGMRRSHPDLYEEIGGVLAQLRRCWFDTSMLDEPHALESVRQSLGVDRLVFGSDLPRGPLSEALRFVTASPLLSDAEKTQILDANGAAALPQPAHLAGKGGAA